MTPTNRFRWKRTSLTEAWKSYYPSGIVPYYAAQYFLVLQQFWSEVSEEDRRLMGSHAPPGEWRDVPLEQ